MSTDALLRAYREDTDKKRLLIRKAETTHDRLIFVTEAMRKLLADEDFVTLLRAEEPDTLRDVELAASHRILGEGTDEIASREFTPIVLQSFSATFSLSARKH
jgi:hypothetical protein